VNDVTTKEFIVGYTDVLHFTHLYRINPSGIMEKMKAIWTRAKNEFVCKNFASYGRDSQILSIFDSIWFRIHIDTEVPHAPNGDPVELLPDVLELVYSYHSEAKNNGLDLVTALAIGHLYIDEAERIKHIQPETTSAIADTIFSLGEPQIQCALAMKSKIPPNGIELCQSLERRIVKNGFEVDCDKFQMNKQTRYFLLPK